MTKLMGNLVSDSCNCSCQLWKAGAFICLQVQKKSSWFLKYSFLIEPNENVTNIIHNQHYSQLFFIEHDVSPNFIKQKLISYTSWQLGDYQLLVVNCQLEVEKRKPKFFLSKSLREKQLSTFKGAKYKNTKSKQLLKANTY